jgi:putative endopeptidase
MKRPFSTDSPAISAFSVVRASLAHEGARRRAAHQVMSDVHSPAIFRVNGQLPNLDAWYVAFGVNPGDKLYVPPDQRVRIW